MDRAINKTTGKLISALEVYKNGAYQNLTKGEWIAPKNSISNWEDISEEDSFVHYTGEKEYLNWNKTLVWCRPHFAKYAGSKAKTIAESPQHKMLKNWLFDKLKKDDLEIVYSSATKKYKYENSSRLSELDIDWNNYDVEVPIRSKKNLRADILLPFKSKHELLGFGLVIEIQISKQNKKYTYERSIDRAINGYSTIWLFENDFELNDAGTEIELKSNKLKVFSFSSELKHSGKRFVRELKLVVEEQCRFLDIKKEELIKKTEEVEEYKEEFIDDAKKSINGFFSYKIGELSKNFSEEVASKVQQNFVEDNEEKINEIIMEYVDNYVSKEVIKNIVLDNISKINQEELLNSCENQIKKQITHKLDYFYSWKNIVSDSPLCPNCKRINLKLIQKRDGRWSYVCDLCKKWVNLPRDIEEQLKRGIGDGE